MTTTAKEEAKYTLITNVQFIQKQNDDLRINCRALLVTEESSGILGPSWTLRGFGVEACWDVFQLWLDKDRHFPFKFETTESRSAVMLTEITVKPLFSGNLLTFKDGTQFFLQADDSSRPIDVHVQHGDICGVWDILAQKTALYWHAPFMPYLQYGPPAMVARLR